MKELTTKEKIILSLEESNKKPNMLGDLVGGFLAIILCSTCIGIAHEQLK